MDSPSPATTVKPELLQLIACSSNSVMHAPDQIPLFMKQLKVNDNTPCAITTPSDLPSEKSVVDRDIEKRIALTLTVLIK